MNDPDMDPSQLSDFCGLCAGTDDVDQIVQSALPLMQNLADAASVMLVGQSADGPVVTHQVGLSLSAALDPQGESSEFIALPLPVEWSTAGVVRAWCRRLPGHFGMLVVAWTTEPPTASSMLTTSANLLHSALARLDAQERLSDLAQRVDSAQLLAGMGDYDWHIPTDTNQWSDQLYRIYGYEPQTFNASYERFLANIHPDDRERIQGIHQQAYATGDPYSMIERIVRPDGEVRYLSSNGEVIMNSEGAPVRMRGTCIDITERVLAERDRERSSNRFRGLVESSPAAILVHDEAGHVLLANHQATELLVGTPVDRLISEVLPPEALGGGAGVEATTLNREPLVLDVTTASLSQTDDEGLTAVFLSDAHPRLEREAMATRLGEAQQRRRQALEINDNVVQGLTSAMYSLEQERADEAATFVERTLIAARGMMDDLLEPTGEHLRAGDLVRTTPASLDPAARPKHFSERLAQMEASTQSAPRVLIVDDAEDIRTLLRLKLSGKGGFEVVGEAVDGEDAVTQARDLQPNLVLLDMAMPRMDGLQALPLIREAVPDVRVIVLSGFNQTTLQEEALAAGADRYVVKGGSMRDLLAIIETVMHAA